VENQSQNIKHYLFLFFKVQGIYYFVTGIWPILHIESFLWVTGPKEEVWLVKIFGLIIAIIGLALYLASRNRPINWTVLILALMSASGFIIAEFYYVVNQIIPPIYMADAIAQLVLLICWVIALIMLRSRTRGEELSPE
jgi:hypothetical protein